MDVDVAALLDAGVAEGGELVVGVEELAGVDWCYLDRSVGRLVVEYDGQAVEAADVAEAVADARRADTRTPPRCCGPAASRSST